MRSDSYRRALYWLAVATAVTALLPIVVGALVTTLDAGMAFRDWPTSDGQGMLAYPWLKSAGDKFAEHGHRLAGMLIGCIAIVFAIATWIFEPRRWVRWCAAGVLVAVVVQGLLGGGRVLADERVLALGHGSFAAAVFSLMASIALVLSRSWADPPVIPGTVRCGALKVLAWLTPLVIVAQYSLGGLVRHLGTALAEHVVTAFVVLACVAATVVFAYRTRCGWFRRSASLLAVLMLCQLALGAAAWVTRFGFPPLGYVAVQRSPLQIVMRTSHTVLGMLLLMSAVILLLKVLRIDWLTKRARSPVERIARAKPMQNLVTSGGLKGRLS